MAHPINDKIPVRSMTGFGTAGGRAAGVVLEIETTSVNRRGLEIVASGPKEWGLFEVECLRWLKGKLHRGRLTISLKARVVAGRDDSNHDLVKERFEHLRATCLRWKVPFQPDARLIQSMLTEIESSEGLPSWEAVRGEVKRILEEALSQLIRMRESEGCELAGGLLERFSKLAVIVDSMERAVEGMVDDRRNALRQRLREAGLDLNPDDERVLRELALFADRVDISEEMDRIRSHLEQVMQLFRDREQPKGRRLEFLLQELQREFNTYGSKVISAEAGKRALAGKNLLEQIREQVANVE